MGTWNNQPIVVKKIPVSQLSQVKVNPLHEDVQKLYPDYYQGYYLEPAKKHVFRKTEPAYACYVYKDCGPSLMQTRKSIEAMTPHNAQEQPSQPILSSLYFMALGTIYETLRMHQAGLTNGDIKLDNFTFNSTEKRIQPIDLEGVDVKDRPFKTGTTGYWRPQMDTAALKHSIDQDRYALAVTIYSLAFWQDATKKLNTIHHAKTKAKHSKVQRVADISSIQKDFLTPPAYCTADHHYAPLVECARRLAGVSESAYTTLECFEYLNQHYETLNQPTTPRPSTASSMSVASTYTTPPRSSRKTAKVTPERSAHLDSTIGEASSTPYRAAQTTDAKKAQKGESKWSRFCARFT
jgi:hypothetical protein